MQNNHITQTRAQHRTQQEFSICPVSRLCIFLYACEYACVYPYVPGPQTWIMLTMMMTITMAVMRHCCGHPVRIA